MKVQNHTGFSSIEEWENGPYARICDVIGIHRQIGVAAFLGIRQTSISDAKRRKAIPAEWLLTLWKKTGVNPDWILNGQGGKYLHASNTAQPGPASALTRDSGPACLNCPIESRIIELKRAVASCSRLTENGGEGALIVWFKGN